MAADWWWMALTLGLLATVAYSDLRSRAVSLPQLLALAAGCTGLAWSRSGSLPLLLNDSAFNLFFLALQAGLTWLWFALKHRRVSKVLDRYIGLGDWLFLIAVAPALTPFRFVWYYATGVFLTLVVALLVRIFYTGSFQTIPLAGGLAAWLALWLLFDRFIPL